MNTQKLKLAILEVVLAGRESPDHLEVRTLCEWAFEWMTEPPAEEKGSNGPHIVVGFPFPELDGLKLGELIERIRTDPNRPTIMHRYDAPKDSPNVTHQTPEEVLGANGWVNEQIGEITYWRKDDITVSFNGNTWGIRPSCEEKTTIPKFWDPKTQSFAYWLESNVAALTEEKAEAGKVEVVIEKAEYKMGIDGNGIEYAEMFMLGKTGIGGTYSYAHRAEGGDCFDFRSTIYTTFARPIHVGTKILVKQSPTGRITLPLEFV